MTCCCLICVNRPEEALKSPATLDAAQTESLLVQIISYTEIHCGLCYLNYPNTALQDLHKLVSLLFRFEKLLVKSELLA
jgi:hypothetical protein